MLKPAMRLVLSIVALAALGCIQLGSPALPTASTAFTHVAVVDVVSGTIVPDQSVVITGNRITAISPTGNARVFPAARVIDASGKYMIPGLWDMHVHAFIYPESTMTLGTRAINVYFPQFIAWGITGIRDMGGWIDTVMAIRQDVRSHQVLGPRIVAAGALIGGKNPWMPPSPHAWVITRPDSAAPIVDSLRRAGADFIKVHDFLTRDVYFAIAAAARRAGLPLVGHLRPSLTVAEALDAGQIGIEHMPIEVVVACASGGRAEADQFYDRWTKGGWTAFLRGTADIWNRRDKIACDRVLKRMEGLGVRITPTTVLRMQDSAFASDVPMTELTPGAKAWCAQSTSDWGSVPDSLRQLYYHTVADILRTMHDAGVVLLAGTDGPGGCLAAGWSLHKELENFVAAGFTPLDALRAATIEPTRFLGLQDSLGTVRRGMIADLVLLDANPLIDIRNARRIAGVVADGRWVEAKRATTVR